jgi:hypothetical protein
MIFLIVRVFSFIGVGLSCVSSFLVLFALLKLKYKDISTYLRLFSTAIDITNTFFCLFYLSQYNYLEGCVSDLVYIYSSTSHGLWVGYMSLVIYKIICLKKIVENKSVFIGFIFTLTLSVLFTLPTLILLGFYSCTDMLMLSFSIYYCIILIIGSEGIIILVIAWAYYKIQKSMPNKVETAITNNKKLFNRIHGYILLFILFFVTNLLSIFELWFNSTILFYSRLIVYSYYSLLNSLLYGMTTSFQRIIKYAFKKNVSFEEQEEYLNELREERIIFPRLYYDILGQSEASALDLSLS